jgi:hypothetical protein
MVCPKSQPKMSSKNCSVRKPKEVLCLSITIIALTIFPLVLLYQKSYSYLWDGRSLYFSKIKDPQEPETGAVSWTYCDVLWLNSSHVDFDDKVGVKMSGALALLCPTPTNPPTPTNIPTPTSIPPDSSPPLGAVVINNDYQYTNSTAVTLTLSASDPESGVVSMQISNALPLADQWEPYTSTKAWVLDSQNGIRTVYVRYKNNEDLQSDVYSDTIVLDTVAPSSTVSYPIQGSSICGQSELTITGEAHDATSYVAHVDVSIDGSDWITAKGTMLWTLNWVPSISCTHSIQSRATDIVHNQEIPEQNVTVYGCCSYLPIALKDYQDCLPPPSCWNPGAGTEVIVCGPLASGQWYCPDVIEGVQHYFTFTLQSESTINITILRYHAANGQIQLLFWAGDGWEPVDGFCPKESCDDADICEIRKERACAGTYYVFVSTAASCVGREQYWMKVAY